MILLIEALRAAPPMGIRALDLGKGDSFYKDRLKGRTRTVAEGRVELPSMAATLRRLRRDGETWIRRSSLLPLARLPGRLLMRLERRRLFK
jgi:CelD/BcsL family acetyltransferase involved in cellulose biosynthesis